MDKLPLDIVYTILSYSNHGTMRNGYIRNDGTIHPCKFIFKLQSKRFLPQFKPIDKKDKISYSVILNITNTKLIEIMTKEIYNNIQYQIVLWNDPYEYKTKKCEFTWHIDECPTRNVIHTHYM
jgi:hypothetical protein